MPTVTISGIEYEVLGDHTGAGSLTEYAGASLVGAAVWAAVDADTRARAHVTATNLLDAAIWQGTKTSGAQALEWPRTGVTYAGEAVDSATVPARIVRGCFELALALLTDPSIATAAGDRTGAIKSVEAKGVGVEWFGPSSSVDAGGTFPPLVQRLVAGYLAADGAAARLGLGESYSAGDAAESAFDDCDTYRVR